MDLCIWENGEELFFSDLQDYLNAVKNLTDMNKEEGTNYSLPDIIYLTNDSAEIERLISVAAKRNYEEKIYDLLDIVEAQGNTLKLS